MSSKNMQKLLSEHPDLQKDLFIRGFLITDQKPDNMDDFPFYGNWKAEQHAGFYFLAHNLTGMHILEAENGNVFFLMGHAYDPFAMEYRESEILRSLSDVFGTPEYLEKINDLTGAFVLGSISDGKIQYLIDPSGMQTGCCGTVNTVFYLSSHAQLIGDLCGLTVDPFVTELTEYKWYSRVFGPYLPADLTPFSDIKRIIPSILYEYANGTVSHRRYWPLTDAVPATDPKEYQTVIEAAADILKNNMELITKKWDRPWISMSGGIDSNTTFAAGNGMYDKFETFSYISAEKEVPDAAAGKKIAEHFGVTHHEYLIPNDNNALPDFEARRELFRHNKNRVAELYDNEARKKFFLRDHAECDVEVKSWVSEAIRAYWCKHFGRKTFPKLSGKLFRNLYKIFICNRTLAHKLDRLYDTYIREYEYDKIPLSYPAVDMYYNEVVLGSCGGANITEMKYCFDLTFIYNNRRFFDLMFRVPLDQQISDQHHLDMKKYLNPELYDMGIRVVNMTETKFRAFALNVIFTINSILPF